MPNPRPNPYVGPRSFQTGETLYGRERETLELLDLLIAERIVLLYSPSGAGKTSLIQAALTPKLREEGFQVLPPIRVSAQPPAMPPPPPGAKPGAPNASGANRFLLSAMLSLEEHLPQAQRTPLTTLAGMTFDAYLKQRLPLASDKPDASPVLIFDQFEEVLTLEPTNLAAKYDFFEQIGEALRDRSRWVLFSMREDYLAGLDPYRRPIPTRFDTTYRLDLLGIAAAREAIQKPALKGGVDFTDTAANKLVNDLRRVQVQRPDGSIELQPGPYVEPVQLQVVCFRLWDKLPQGKNTILESDITDIGDVNTALSDFYGNAVRAAAASTGVNERAIREWFDRQLITEQGLRGQVLMEPERSRGLDNRAIRALEDAHLVRADERRGATWFELAHDRLIEPVRTNNAAWFRENLSPLQQQADLWNRQGRPDGLLLRDKALDDAAAWAAAHASELEPTEKEFLSQSQEARDIALREQKQNRRIRLLAIGASVLSVIALLALCAAGYAAIDASNNFASAQRAEATAVANEKIANAQKLEIVKQDRVSKMVSAALSQLEVDPEVSLLLATEAYSLTQDVNTDDALRQAVNASRLRGTLRGHSSSVDVVAISPDGKEFATGSGDSTIKLWDAVTGKVIRTLQGHTAPVWAVTFSRDGARLATSSEDGTARIWDLTKCTDAGCPFIPLTGHEKSVWAAQFSPDGKQVATAGEDGTVRLWDAASGAQTALLKGHNADVTSLAYSPDGRTLLSTSLDQTARLWDLGGCTPTDCPSTVINGQAALWNSAFSPDGKTFVLASDDQNAYTYDRESQSITNYLSGHNDAVFGVAYSPDGKYIATASRDGTARIWDAHSAQSIATLRGHESTIWSAAFSPDSHLLLTGSDDGTAKLWAVTDGSELRVLRGHLSKVLGADFSGDGKRVITASTDQTALVWDAQTEEVVADLVGHTNWVTDGALNRDGTRAATASFDNTARIWDLTQCNAEHTDCPSIELQGHTDVVRGVTFSPDDSLVLTASDDRTARVWDAQTGELKLTLGGYGGQINHAFFSPDGKWIVTAGSDQTARIWDAATGDEKLVLQGHAGAVQDATFNADGTLVVTASDDRTARVWDVGAALASGAKTAEVKQELRGHTGAVTSAVFSHDNKFIVTGSSDKTARIWDAATGAEESVLRGHTDKVQTVELSPDDRFVLTASSDRTARIALEDIGAVAELARTRATRALSCDEWLTILQEPNFCPGGGVTQNAGALPTIAPVTSAAVLSGPVASTPAASPTSQAAEPTGAVTATLVPATPTVEPTIAPTATPPPTETAQPTAAAATLPPTQAAEPTTAATATALPTETIEPTAVPTATNAPPTTAPTAVPPTQPPPTPTPALEPGVYVSRINFVPLNPGSSPASGEFHVSFLNNTDSERGFTRWKMLIFVPGGTKSTGDTLGQDKVFAPGVTEHVTSPYRLGLAQCQTLIGKPVWEDQEGRQTPFLATDGKEASLQFQMCP